MSLSQLGGGLELALQSDILLASPSAQLGLPEITLGVIPGGGGTQRLVRLVGKSRAMELVLTGRIIGADEAEKWGLVNRIVPEDVGVVNAAVQMAATIADKGRIAVTAGKEAVNAALDLSLAEGLRFERRLFHSLFATKDQKEGKLLGGVYFHVGNTLTALQVWPRLPKSASLNGHIHNICYN